MSVKPLFEGLIYDEEGKPVSVTYVGQEPCYVVEWMGMHYHIPTEQVDRTVLRAFRELIRGHEDFLAKEMSLWLQQPDPFTQATIKTQLEHWDEHIDELLRIGLPEEVRATLGFLGLRITIDFRGDLIHIHWPGESTPPDDRALE